MLPSPADNGGNLGWPVQAAEDSGDDLPVPRAEALVILPTLPRRFADAGIGAGGCFARPLPMDPTCAGAARKLFREAVTGLALPDDLVHDGVTMASELAANTLHALRAVEAGLLSSEALVSPEIWIYLRGHASKYELVCKVFDCMPTLDAAAQARAGLKAPSEWVSGRGLQVVAGLSAGQWGCHPSRARLGSHGAAGKAVWFALRIPPAALPDWQGWVRPSPEEAVRELATMLADRGLVGTIVRGDDRDGSISVLSVSRHLTVWRHGDTVTWRDRAGSYQRLNLAELVEVTEQIVSAHEDSAARDVAV
jgi:hypothetical protein